MGDRKLAGIAAADIGSCALGIFRRGPDYIGSTIGIAGEHLTGADIAAALSNTFAEPVHYLAMAPATYAKLGFPGADDLANMFQYYQDFSEEFLAQRPITPSRELHPALMGFAQWPTLNGSGIPHD